MDKARVVVALEIEFEVVQDITRTTEPLQAALTAAASASFMLYSGVRLVTKTVTGAVLQDG